MSDTYTIKILLEATEITEEIEDQVFDVGLDDGILFSSNEEVIIETDRFGTIEDVLAELAEQLGGVDFPIRNISVKKI